MKKILTFLILAVLSLSIGLNTIIAQTASPSPPGNAQNNGDTVNITVQDLKVFRQAVTDKVYFENRAKVFEESNQACQADSGKWQNLYRAEKDRADNIQGARIGKLEEIIKEKELRIGNYITQANQFRDENIILQSDVKRLKKQRWKIGAISFGTGFGLGGLAGYR